MIRTPEDIAALPWSGNFADDRELFQAVEDYAFIEPDLAKRQGPTNSPTGTDAARK